MKKLIRLVVLLVLLIIVALGAAWFYIDTIARSAVERGGTYATGVKTSLKRANVKVFSGQFVMSELTFANPEGYQSDHFLTLGKGNVALTLASLREDVIRLPHLNLSDLDMNLEKKDGKANYQVIIDNLKKLSSGSSEGGKKYVIDRVNLRNITAHVKVLGQNLDVPIEKITLKDVGSGGNGLQMSELTGVIVKAVFEAVVKQAGNLGVQLPAELLSDLTHGLSQLGDLDKLAEVADIEAVGDVTKKAAEEATKAAEDLTKKAGEGIGKILGGDKDKPK